MKAVLLLAATLLFAPLSAPAGAADLHPACSAGGVVDESGFVSINGIEQWISIEGRDCANPVVLVVHGGPGNPNTPYAHAIYGPWADEFTVVQWDQRSAGKTWEANPDTRETPLTIEQMAGDGIEVARYAAQRFGKGQVILVGGSWGAALAVHMALGEPSLFQAYIGSSQLVSVQAGDGYARVLQLAREAGDDETVATLEALGTPPWTDPRSTGILRRATRKYEAQVSDAAPSEWWQPAPGYDTPEYAAAYEAAEDFSFIQFVGMDGDGIASRLDLRNLGNEFAMPVYLVQGKNDLVTPAELTRAWFDTLVAPSKEYILVGRTGHDPNQIMIDVLLNMLRAQVPMPD